MGRYKKITLDELTREQKFEIVESYKTAKDQGEQIKILSELYDATPLTIRKVLREAGIDDHENDSGTRFTLIDRAESEQADADDFTDETTEEETEEKEDAEIISISSGPFYRAEAILALIAPDDCDSIKEKAIALIAELVGAASYEKLFGEDMK